jgi:DNA polymerase-3 subunit epsilon
MRTLMHLKQHHGVYACAIGIVSIEKNKITKKGYRLIRPPRRHFVFSYIHGISCADVEAHLAHNAPFDRNVLTACCSAAGRRPPRVPFICTVQVARSHWNFRPANLPTVCTQSGISLRHHLRCLPGHEAFAVRRPALHRRAPLGQPRRHKLPRPRDDSTCVVLLVIRAVHLRPDLLTPTAAE